MKSIFLLVFSSLIFMAGRAQDAGDKNLQTRTVSGFHGISVSGGIDLYLSAGPQSVAVSASDPAYRDQIVTEVENGILKIHMEKGARVRGNARLKAFVSVTALDMLNASGGSDTYLQTAINAKNLAIHLSGGSDLRGQLSADNLVVSQSGGSDIDLTGRVKILNVNQSGGSGLKGFGLVSDFVAIQASGGCDTHITANKELKVMASGGSDVFYKGSATVSEIKSSGSSSVVKKG